MTIFQFMYYIKSFDLLTLCNLATVFAETKSVTKSRLHCTVHVTLPKLPILYLKLDEQRRQQTLKVYCPNTYTVLTLGNGKVPTLSNFDFDCKIVTE